MRRIDNFKSIIDQYNIIFFDAFGVIKNYKGLVPGIERTFDYLEKQNKKKCFKKNSDYSPPWVPEGEKKKLIISKS